MLQDKIYEQLKRTPGMSHVTPPGLKKIKGVYYDTTTANTSFILCSKDLQTSGVKNHYFMLALYDKDLYKVDPYDPTLDPFIVNKIIVECMRNPWYFLREVCRIPAQGGSAVQFRINRATLAVIWCFIHGIDGYLTIARQIGKTESIISILTWAFLFGTTDSQFMFMHIDKPRAAGNLKKLKMQKDLLPIYMQQKYKFVDGKLEKGTDNVQSISNAINNNNIVTMGQATSAEGADNLARGLSQPIQFFDEFEFIKHNDIILAVAGPAFVTASKNARDNNAIYGRIFSSTAGDLDSNAGRCAQKLLCETYRWTERLYDEWREKGIDHVKNIIAKGCKSQVVYIEYHYFLLGKGDEYYYEQSRVINDVMKFKREILLQRLHGSSESPYDPEDIENIMQSKRDPIEEIFLLGIYKFKIYTKLDPFKTYFMGIDISDGYGQDNTTIVVWDPQTLKVVATLGSTFISHPELVKLITLLAQKFVRRGPIIIERNRGAAVIASLCITPIKSRLYYEDPKDQKTNETLDEYGRKLMEARQRRNFGVATTTKTRPMMFEILFVYVREYKDSFVCGDIVSELNGLVKKNGKIQAGVGFHDDFIMAFLMCLYVYEHGKNLIRYGFKRGVLPSQQVDEKMDSRLTDYQKQMLILQEYPEEIRAQFQPVKSQVDLEREYYMQMQQARAEASDDSNVIVGGGTINYGDNYNAGGGYNLGGSFFDGLNDL